MATKGKEVHALEAKVRVIAEIFGELGIIASGSRREFAAFADIDYDSLKTAWRSGRLSNELEQKLAKAAGFDPNDPNWVDENVDPAARAVADKLYPGRDTIANFRAMLRRRFELPGYGTAVRIFSERPQLIDNNLATFSVEDSGQEMALGEPAPMFLCAVLERGFHPRGVEYGFSRVRFRFVFSEHSQIRVKQRLPVENSIEINGAILEARGTEHHTEWFFRVENSILEGEYMTKDHPLCALDEIVLGEDFYAEISVRPKDGSLLAVNGAPLEDMHKRRIIECLCAKKIPGLADTQGWISLGRQRLRVIRADRT